MSYHKFSSIYNKKWFSTIVSILLTAFLIVLSSGVLFLVLRETSITRTAFNTISTYAWSEWALEYALLKIKNHSDWFQDKINKDDDDSKILANNSSKINKNKDALISYEMFNFSKDYTSTILPQEFEIIPLFFDKWRLIQTNSKDPNKQTSDIAKTLKFIFNSWTGITRNIIWNDSSWNSFWIVWTGSIFWTWYSALESSWILKKTYSNSSTDADDFVFDYNYDIGSFLSNYTDNYLIIYNNNSSSITYNLKSYEWFSTPKTEVISSSNIWDFKQNIRFQDDKSKYFDMLKYSLFNK